MEVKILEGLEVIATHQDCHVVRIVLDDGQEFTIKDSTGLLLNMAVSVGGQLEMLPRASNLALLRQTGV